MPAVLIDDTIGIDPEPAPHCGPIQLLNHLLHRFQHTPSQSLIESRSGKLRWFTPQLGLFRPAPLPIDRPSFMGARKRFRLTLHRRPNEMVHECGPHDHASPYISNEFLALAQGVIQVPISSLNPFIQTSEYLICRSSDHDAGSDDPVEHRASKRMVRFPAIAFPIAIHRLNHPAKLVDTLSTGQPSLPDRRPAPLHPIG